MTPHIEAKDGEIAKTVIMPGDPMRAKLIAKTYLKDYKLVNKVRSIYAYTGYYNDKKVTVMASGMGMPSMGIYAYELYKFYDVDTIIRIGSCGAYSKDLNLFDLVLADNAYTEGNFALAFNDENLHQVESSREINDKILDTAKKLDYDITLCDILTNECFDAYIDVDKMLSRIDSSYNPKAAEMEAFALFYIAKVLNKKAACIITVADCIYSKETASSSDREKSLTKMITLALESV